MINNKYDFAIIFDVADGNPNGDPDAGNLPRIDAETGMGIVTDVCLKRKIRNYVQLTKKCIPPYDIYIKQKLELGDAAEPEQKTKDGDGKSKKNSVDCRDFCSKFFDVRTFGAVLTSGSGNNAGQVLSLIHISEPTRP